MAKVRVELDVFDSSFDQITMAIQCSIVCLSQYYRYKIQYKNVIETFYNMYTNVYQKK